MPGRAWASFVVAGVVATPAGVVAGGVDPGLGPGGVLAQPVRAAVAASPLLIDQAVQQVRGGQGEFLQRAHIAVVPPGLLARATCTVKDGTCSPERGRRDDGHLGGSDRLL